MTKCIVKDCSNHQHLGKFIGDLCSPCFSFLVEGEGTFSQLYRNTVLAEREACAKLCDEYDMQTWADYGEYSSGYGDEIRKRNKE
jgi:hypothetical protein